MEISLLVQAKNSFDGFYPCDLDTVNKLSFSLSKEAPHKNGFDWPSGSLNMQMDDGWNVDGH